MGKCLFLEIIKSNTTITLVIAGVCFYVQHGLTRPMDNRTPFNVEDIICRVSHHHSHRTGEFLIDTNFNYIPAPGNQYYPSVAFDGTNYLVVWSDNRNDSYSDIYGARVSQTGVVLDTVGIAISSATNYQSSPSVAFDGTNYLVVWTDERNGVSDIYGARVRQTGVVLDPAGIAISTATSNQGCPSVTFAVMIYLVVWQDNRNGVTDIYGARVSQTGVVLDTTGIAISTAANDQWYPSVAFDDTNYLVVWSDTRSGSSADIYGTRVSQTGAVLDTLGIAISTAANYQWLPSVAFDDTNYLVVWHDGRSGSSDDIYGARVSQTGVVLDTTGIAISTAANYQWLPSVDFDGANYLVVWHDTRSDSSRDIYGARVSQTGAVLDPAGIAISTDPNGQLCPSVASGGTNYLVVWGDGRSGSSDDIYGARVSQTGVVLDTTGMVISTSVHFYHQYYPSVAFDGINYLVVWEDYRTGLTDIYGARVSQTGAVLDPTGIAISTTANDQWLPSVAFDGANYLVVWSDERSGSSADIYGARVSQIGVVLDTLGITISTAANDQWYPSVAFDGANYLVVWGDGRSGSSDDIYGARVSQTGVVLDTLGIAISTAANSQWYPSVVFDGANYLVVWEDYRHSTADIFGARISQAGVVLDTGIVISTAANYQCFPSIAFDGINYLVVWEEIRSGSYWDIYGARVRQTGVVLDTLGIAISTAANSQWYPSVAFDGINYLVVWQDSRNSVLWDIYAAKVSPSGTVIDSFVVSTQSREQISPAVALGADSMLVTYSGWCDSISGFPANTMRIWGKFYPVTGIVENTTQKPKAKSPKLQIYPNPFCEKTDIRWQMLENTKIDLKIYGVTGQLVKDFSRLTLDAQHPTLVSWNGEDECGKAVAQGVYFIRVENLDSGKTLCKKVLKVR